MLLALIVVFWITLYLYVRQRFNYFRSHGVPHEPGYFPLGSPTYIKALCGQVAFFGLADEIYRKHPQHKVVGYYGMFGKPFLVIRDFEIMKKVLVKDFQHFTDRVMNVDYMHPETNKYFANMISIMEGHKWRSMRSLITPIFTSGKIKATAPLVQEAALGLVQHFQQSLLGQESIDIKEQFGKFTAQVLGKLGCGVDPQMFQITENNPFYQQVLKLTGGGKPNFKQVLSFLIVMMAPRLAYYLKIPMLDAESSHFFAEIIRKSIKSQKRGSFSISNDFIHFLTEAMNESNEYRTMSEDVKEDLIISNVMNLFLAGYDTTSSGLAICAHFLAKNPHVQDKLYNEIRQVLGDNFEDTIDFNELNELDYLDSVISESLRLWGLNFYDRKCTKDYYLNDINFTIPKGMYVQNGGAGLMQEESLYANPSSFDPEAHFGKGDQSATTPPFLGFGIGPRNCAGKRFALLMMKTCLVNVLTRFQFVICSKTIKDWIMDPTNPSSLPKGGLHVKLEARISA